MKNNIDNILLAALVAVITVGGIALININKSTGLDPIATSTNASTSLYNHPPLTGNSAAFLPNSVKYQNFAMPEPFAEHVPFEFTPEAWMQMMNTMMNNMQLTQLMHQMAAIPQQMMSPMMWANPHNTFQNGAVNPSVQPMSPEQYKKWYEQQLKLQQSSR